MTHVEIECPHCFVGEAIPGCYYCQGSVLVTKCTVLKAILDTDPSWLELHLSCKAREQT
jgi:hypothetical protein